MLIDLYLSNLQKNFELFEQISKNLSAGNIEEVLSDSEKWWLFHMDLINENLSIEDGVG